MSAVCCSVLLGVTVCFSLTQRFAMCCSVGRYLFLLVCACMQGNAGSCCILQRVCRCRLFMLCTYVHVVCICTGCCRVLQGVAGRYRVLQDVTGCYRVLQGVAGCCRVLQCGAWWCSARLMFVLTLVCIYTMCCSIFNLYINICMYVCVYMYTYSYACTHMNLYIYREREQESERVRETQTDIHLEQTPRRESTYINIYINISNIYTPR